MICASADFDRRVGLARGGLRRLEIGRAQISLLLEQLLRAAQLALRVLDVDAGALGVGLQAATVALA